MSRPVLVDSCWYIERMRAGQDPLRELAVHAQSRDIATCGIVVAEVGRGIQVRKQLDRYRAAWEVMLFVSSSNSLWDSTLELAWQLDRQGKVLPLQDLHIAVCALHIGAVVLTVDEHFQQIPGLDATDRIY